MISPTVAGNSVVTLLKWVFGVENLSFEEAKELVDQLPAGLVREHRWLQSIYNSNNDVWRSARHVAKSFFMEEVT